MKNVGAPKGTTPWNKGTRGLVKPNSGSFKKGRVMEPWNKGMKMSDEFGAKITRGLTGRLHSESAKQKIRVSKLGKKRGPLSEQWRRNMSAAHLRHRERNPNWRGGITAVNEQIRKSLEYKLWRESVFARDNYTCIWCGQVGGDINADHIKPFALFPELRFAIDNGRTLCRECHKTTDTYGFKTQHPK